MSKHPKYDRKENRIIAILVHVNCFSFLSFPEHKGLINITTMYLYFYEGPLN